MYNCKSNTKGLRYAERARKLFKNTIMNAYISSSKAISCNEKAVI